MPPQHPDIMHLSPVKSSSSGDGSGDRYDALDISSQKSSVASSKSYAHDGYSRAAEEWLSRRKVTPPRSPLSDAMNRRGGATDASPSRTGSTSVDIAARTSLRERLQARMKEASKSEPLHAEATLRLLTKGLAQRNPPPPPPPSPHSTPTSQVMLGRKSPRELDSFLQSETKQGKTADVLSATPPPPPPPPARVRSPKILTKDESLKKQKIGASTSNAVTRIMEAISDNKHHHQSADTAAAHASLLRLSRQVQYGKKEEPRKENKIKLHIYDLLTTETYVQLGWGCEFPIGQCFNAVNDGLHALGTGAYHCGIEINGIEYAYGANSSEGCTGVFSCIPKHSPGFEYRTTLDFGSRPLIKRSWVRVNEKGTNTSVYREVVHYIDGRDVMKEMAKEYLGPDYDLLRRNCCTFARDASLRLGIREDEIPSWFMNLAGAGAATHDVAVMTLKPITSMLSGIEDDNDSIIDANRDEEKTDDSESGGFEIIAQTKEGRLLHDKMEIVKVVEALNMTECIGPKTCAGTSSGPIQARRTCSWA